MSIIYTGTIPQCPNCNKPTIRTPMGASKTCLYYPPQYNELGENINPDLNTITEGYMCDDCKQYFAIAGNHTEGCNYK